MLKYKITRIGTSVGIVLGKEVLSKLHVKRGDDIFLIETTTGFELVAYDPEFEEQMNIAVELRKKNRNALHMLAKS